MSIEMGAGSMVMEPEATPVELESRDQFAERILAAFSTLADFMQGSTQQRAFEIQGKLVEDAKEIQNRYPTPTNPRDSLVNECAYFDAITFGGKGHEPCCGQADSIHADVLRIGNDYIRSVEELRRSAEAPTKAA